MSITGLLTGIVFGAVLQRGRFCVTGMLRDIFLNKTWRGFTALLILISVHAFGLTLLTGAGVLSPEISDFKPVAVIVGGFIFGLGIILSGGCASGTWYRSAEGLGRLVDCTAVLWAFGRGHEVRPAVRCQ